MTDLELINLASKASGFEYTKQDNPLVSDALALRLAVQLGMLFTYMPDRFDLFQRFYREEFYNDLRPTEATRRAIVRAAAELGKEMP